MARMKTFLLYVLGILGFMFLSFVLEDGLIQNMYVEMTGGVVSENSDVSIDNVIGKASNVNGNIQFELVNNSQNQSNCFAQIDLYNKKGKVISTEYVPITDLKPGDSKTYQVKFKGKEIRDYKISLINEAPNQDNIIKIFGYKFDLANVFGLDLTNVKIFGVKLADIFTIDNAKTAGGNAISFATTLIHSVPLWGYVAAGCIVGWYLPAGFLFGIL